MEKNTSLLIEWFTYTVSTNTWEPFVVKTETTIADKWIQRENMCQQPHKQMSRFSCYNKIRLVSNKNQSYRKSAQLKTRIPTVSLSAGARFESFISDSVAAWRALVWRVVGLDIFENWRSQQILIRSHRCHQLCYVDKDRKITFNILTGCVRFWRQVWSPAQ